MPAMHCPPKMLAPKLDAIPKALKACPQWVCWRLESRGGKWTKSPINAKSRQPKRPRYAKSDDPSTWTTFDRAQSFFAINGLAGIGFMFAVDGGMAGVDLDKCRNPQTGVIEQWARDIITELNTYAEVSPSGSGVKLFLQGKIPGKRRRKGNIELYDSGRYFTVTGHHVEGTPRAVEDRQRELTALCARVFADEKATSGEGKPPPVVRDDDAALIERAKRARNGEKFSCLWAGSTDGYASDSEADQALCNLLAFYTGPDQSRIDRLFRQSGLYREKWNRADYRNRTIGLALKDRREFYSPRKGTAGGNGRGSVVTGPLHCTDMGNAQRFVQQHGAHVRYCYPWRKWLLWTGTHWREDDDGSVVYKAKQTVRTIYREAADCGDSAKREALGKWAHSCESEHRIKAMLALAQSEPGVPISLDVMDADPWALNCRNGTVDLRNGELREHRPTDLITKLCPAEYNSRATCPQWIRFLRCVLNCDEGLLEFLQRAIGYSLTGDIREQVIFILHGKGANGKSTLLDTVRGLLGDYATTAPPDLLTIRRNEEHPTQVADLFGRRLVIACETEEGKRLRVQFVKQATGDSFLKARRMRQDYFEFPRRFKLFLATNNKPRIREASKAIWRRIRLVPFGVVIPEEEQDPELLEKLRAEWPGILAWAVRGCLAWQAEGLPIVEAITDATEQYQGEQDVLTPFLEAGRLDVRPRAKITRGDIARVYLGWARETDERFPLDRNELFERLRTAGFADARYRHNGRVQRGFQGIGLLASKTIQA